MFERFNKEAREVFTLAGELAARRERDRRGLSAREQIVNVEIRVGDLREALRLRAPEGGWSGGCDLRLTTRLARLNDGTGPITVEDLRDVLR